MNPSPKKPNRNTTPRPAEPAKPAPIAGKNGGTLDLSVGAPLPSFSEAAPVVDLGSESPTRRYVPTVDYKAKPMLFIQEENAPFEGHSTLKNGFFILKNKYTNNKALPWEVYEPGADKSGCALLHVAVHTKKEAILAALELKPFEPLPSKRARVEAAARASSHPDMAMMVGDLLDGCKNMFGKPIDGDARLRIQDYMLTPSVERWEAIHGIILQWPIAGKPGHPSATTVWQHWIKNDPSAPRSGPAQNVDGVLSGEWDRIPSAMDMVVLLRSAATDPSREK